MTPPALFIPMLSRGCYKHIVLVVASLEIPTLLLSSGRTGNSIFKIPIDINENFTCDIKKGTQFTSLINKTSLVIWDKSPMNHG